MHYEPIRHLHTVSTHCTDHQAWHHLLGNIITPAVLIVWCPLSSPLPPSLLPHFFLSPSLLPHFFLSLFLSCTLFLPLSLPFTHFLPSPFPLFSSLPLTPSLLPHFFLPPFSHTSSSLSLSLSHLFFPLPSPSSPTFSSLSLPSFLFTSLSLPSLHSDCYSFV